jgi:hypothetical protein
VVQAGPASMPLSTRTMLSRWASIRLVGRRWLLKAAAAAAAGSGYSVHSLQDPFYAAAGAAQRVSTQIVQSLQTSSSFAGVQDRREMSAHRDDHCGELVCCITSWSLLPLDCVLLLLLLRCCCCCCCCRLLTRAFPGCHAWRSLTLRGG